jgi:hypothetical protein
MDIDTRTLDYAIKDCLTDIGHGDASYVALVHSGNLLAIGTNIRDKDAVLHILAKAMEVVTRQRDQMAEVKGTA